MNISAKCAAPSVLIANPQVLVATDLADGLRELAPEARIEVCHSHADFMRRIDAGEIFDIVFVASSMHTRDRPDAVSLATALGRRVIVTGNDHVFEVDGSQVMFLPTPFTSESVAHAFNKIRGGASPCPH